MDDENSLSVLFVGAGSKRVGATTFSTVSRALAYGSRQVRPDPRKDRELKTQSAEERGGVKRGECMTTRARASAGEWAGGWSAPVASAKAAPSRVRTLPGVATDAGRLSPLPAGRWLLAVTRVFSTAPVDQCG
jgi:hypothetical protein